jgi:hypothetical protein
MLSITHAAVLTRPARHVALRAPHTAPSRPLLARPRRGPGFVALTQGGKRGGTAEAVRGLYATGASETAECDGRQREGAVGE